jgi:hypothetical protein
MKIETETKITRRKAIKVTGRHLIELLNATFDEPPIPLDASVTVRVPGGTDWSNDDLDIDADCPVIVEWKEEEHHG